MAEQLHTSKSQVLDHLLLGLFSLEIAMELEKIKKIIFVKRYNNLSFVT